MIFITTHAHVARPDRTGERLSPGFGSAIGVGVSVGLWALLIYGAIRLFV